MRFLHAFVSRQLSRLSPVSGVMLLGAALLACHGNALVPRYAEPEADEPHAIVKLRSLYLDHPGEQLDELVTVGGDRIDLAAPTAATRTNAFRVRPETTAVEIESDFFDVERHMVRESYQVSEQYYCGTQRSGFGSNTYTTSKYCTRSVTKYRNKWVTVRHPRGACRKQIDLSPKPGDVYLLQYTFNGPGLCELSCVRQRFSGPGQFQNQPCETVAPATETR